jgi:hypothetical protein
VDDGLFKSPKWFRHHDTETLLKWSKIPKLFTQQNAVSSTLLRTYMDEYERGSLLTLIASNTELCARAAASVLTALIKRGETGRWVTASGYIEMVKAEWDEEDMSRYSTPHLVKYINATFDVLVLDGLGEEHGTQFTNKALGSLIKGRHERGLSTLITPPHDTTSLGHMYGGRVGSYIGSGEVLPIGR